MVFTTIVHCEDINSLWTLDECWRSESWTGFQAVELVKCSRAAVKTIKDWSVNRKTGYERADCGRHRLVLLGQNGEWHQITAVLHLESSQMISEHTVRRTLHRTGYGHLLYVVDKRKCLQVAQEEKDCTDKKTTSDESRFQLQHSNDSVRICWKYHECMELTCTTFQADRSSVWGLFYWQGLDPFNSCTTTFEYKISTSYHVENVSQWRWLLQ